MQEQEQEQYDDGQETSDVDPFEVVVGCEGCGGYKYAGERFCSNCRLEQTS